LLDGRAGRNFEAMKIHATSSGSANLRLRRDLGFLLAVAATFLLALGGTASAHRLVGRDGKIHACYRVKGKPRGALRVVRSRRAHCLKGERRVAWTVAGAEGAGGSGGSAGTQGGQGSPGQAGTQGAIGTTLAEQVKSLSARIEGLEETLDGVSNTDLTGMLATLQGISSEDLTRVVKSLPAIESVCEQSEALTKQVNLVAEVVEGLGLNGVLKTLGGVLEIPELPEPLDESFSCPSF
jgi:hypothetical protein